MTNMENGLLEIFDWRAMRRSGWEGPGKFVIISGHEVLDALTLVEDYLGGKGFWSKRLQLEEMVPVLAEYLSEALKGLETDEEVDGGERSEQGQGERKRESDDCRRRGALHGRKGKGVEGAR